MQYFLFAVGRTYLFEWEFGSQRWITRRCTSVAQNPRSIGIVCWCPENPFDCARSPPFSVAPGHKGTLAMFETMTAVMGLVSAAIFLAHAFEGICLWV